MYFFHFLHKKIKFDDELLGKLEVYRTSLYDRRSYRISGIDYTYDGSYLLASYEDNSIELFSTKTGHKIPIPVFCKRYGIGKVRYTHYRGSVIHSSLRYDHAIRHLCLYDNRYIRYYYGHTDVVTSLQMNPRYNWFLSASRDMSVRMWDLRVDHFVARLCFSMSSGNTVAAFDPSGCTIGVGIDNDELAFMDVRYYKKGPFIKMYLDKTGGIEFKEVVFNHDGKTMLIGTNQDKIILVDVLNFSVQYTLRGFKGRSPYYYSPSFTPDARYVVCGTHDSCINYWDVKTGELAYVQETEHLGPVRFARFHPKDIILTTAHREVMFYAPNDTDVVTQKRIRQKEHEMLPEDEKFRERRRDFAREKERAQNKKMREAYYCLQAQRRIKEEAEPKADELSFNNSEKIVPCCSYNCNIIYKNINGYSIEPPRGIVGHEELFGITNGNRSTGLSNNSLCELSETSSQNSPVRKYAVRGYGVESAVEKTDKQSYEEVVKKIDHLELIPTTSIVRPYLQEEELRADKDPFGNNGKMEQIQMEEGSKQKKKKGLRGWFKKMMF